MCVISLKFRMNNFITNSEFITAKICVSINNIDSKSRKSAIKSCTNNFNFTLFDNNFTLKLIIYIF